MFESERQDLNTQRGKRESGPNNQGDEQKGSEVNTDEDKTDLQSKTGNKLDNRRGDKTTKQNLENTEGNQESLPWLVQTMTIMTDYTITQTIIDKYKCQRQRSCV